MSPRPLAHLDAPGLHALLGAPVVVLLAPDATFRASRGSVTIGIGLLALLDVPELNALLARERAARAGAGLFGSWTRAARRRHVLEADARTADGAALAAALAKAALAPHLHRTYLALNVGLAIDAGAVPADVAAGFIAFARRFAERGASARILATMDSASPDARGLPSLAERLRALPTPARPRDDASAPRALDLLAFDHEGWLAGEMRTRWGTTLPVIPWVDIPERVLAPRVLERARALGVRLAPVVRAPSFVSVHDALANGKADEIATALEPRLARVPAAERSKLVPETLAPALVALLSAALLEDGGAIASILGEDAPLFRHRDEVVSPLVHVLRAMSEGPTAPGLAPWAAALR